MPQIYYKIIISAAIFAYLASIGVNRQGREIHARSLSCLGLALIGSAALAGWGQNLRLPLYGLYETSLHLALVLGMCLELAAAGPGNARLWSSGRLIAGALLGIAWTAAGEFKFDFYIYHSLPVQLFFFLRLTAAGVVLFAFLLFAMARVDIFLKKTQNPSAGIRQAVNTLIGGALLFLGSELAGTVWCMRGWGDIWHWSANFFESAALFLLLMVPLHLPAKLKNHTFHAWAGMICTLWMVLAIALP